jgi:hypothetical protein
MPLLIAGGTCAMNWFSACFRFFQFVSECSRSKVFELVALHLAALCFEGSYLFFKLVHSLNQRKLRLLCGENFFLQFYDRTVANVASLMSFRAFAISKAVFSALAPIIASLIMTFPPSLESV